jgi:HPt (histidine-containing phosphotransfer) domain-containing protein
MSSDPASNDPIRSEFSDDPEMTELVRMFVDEMPHRINAIQQACDEARFNDLGTLAHQIKGASGGYGFPALGDTARALEVAIKHDRETESIRREVERLVDMCRRVSP